MSSGPKVTVLIPTFNRAHYLPEAIQSIFAQTFTDYELIVVDDGSTDDTVAILAGFRDPRLRVLRQENRGISAAMNAGLRAARGEYITRLDSDDVWLADLLACETAVLDAHPDVGVVYAKAQAMTKDGASREHHIGLPLRYPHDALLSLAWGDSTCNIALLARQVCFATAGVYDETLYTHEDWDMWLRVARRHRFIFLDRTLARFREHEHRITSPSSPMFVEHVESRVRVIDKLYSRTALPAQLHAFKSIIYRNVYTEIGLSLFNTGHRVRALRMFKHAMTSGCNPIGALARILWFAIVVRSLTRFGVGRAILRLQAQLRRRWRGDVV
jgi:glycosyltransferase involved in cell wall biosynthesis